MKGCREDDVCWGVVAEAPVDGDRGAAVGTMVVKLDMARVVPIAGGFRAVVFCRTLVGSEMTNAEEEDMTIGSRKVAVS